MKGYKVFNPDWTCRGFQFEVGKIFTEDVTPVCCDRGFHFCTKIVDCFNYYDFNPNNKVAEVEALGDIDINKDGSKCSTNKIYIIKELTWHEVLDLVNIGEACTGSCNSGDNNSGNNNSGDYNSGNKNGGSFNSGDRNSGGRNSGNYNSGNFNSGNYNSGDCNSGDYNSGDGNSGDCNSGDCNSGDWNETDFSNGCFNTELSRIFLFNKLSDWTYRDWMESDARFILMECPSDITDEQKEQNPEYSTGDRQAWWNSLTKREKDTIMNIPNFDKDIFKRITGIDVEAL